MIVSKKTLAALAAIWLAFAAVGAHAQAPNLPQLGRDYVRLEPPRPVTSGDKIELIGFFYYGCPVCYDLEPALARWASNASASVELRRIPALSADSWNNLAKLFYALEATGHLASLHWPVYDSLQFEDIKLNDEAVMLDWVSRNGVDREKFISAYHAPEMPARLAAAREATRNYEIKGVPSIVIDGKFVTSVRMAGGVRELMQIVAQLVDLARKERGK